MRISQIFALAWRESRFARRRLLLFLSAISLGVAALVAVEGFARNLERGVERESKALLGADRLRFARLQGDRLAVEARDPLAVAIADLDAIAQGASLRILVAHLSFRMDGGGARLDV